MKKTAKKTPVRMGRPPKQGDGATVKSLGSVRVSDERLASYTAAAKAMELPRADWIRDVLDKAAARVLKARGK